MKIDKTVDIKGEHCPFTFVRSKLVLETMKAGEILEIVTDHEPATQNVPRSMENEGHKLLDLQKINETDWRIIIQKQK